MSERAEKITKDLKQLPRFSDGWTFLFTERVRVEREDDALLLMDAEGCVLVPVASLSALLLGPGSAITHAAVMACAESGCSIVWCGENGVRFYACGLGETRHASNLMAQASAWADPKKRLEVVMRMYRMRFSEPLDAGLTLEQVRGLEGVRVREAYARAARETGVVWNGRAYRRGDWGAADPVNRALSAANACLYGLCHAGIVATGFTPGLGFVHTGKLLSFVYDVADFYKAEVSVPAAFAAVAGGATGVETRARRLVREKFVEEKLLQRVVPDMQRALGLRPDAALLITHGAAREGVEGGGAVNDEDVGLSLWDPEKGVVEGGKNFGDVEEEEEGGDEG